MTVKDFPEYKTDINLSRYNTLGVSATASAFIEITSKNQLRKLSKQGYFESNRPFVLGGGSNILFLGNPERDILKMSIKGKNILDKSNDIATIEVGAGVDWHQFVTWAVENNLGGIENLALIPGTVGAAPIQNIGAYGVELEEVFYSLELFDMRDQIFKTFSRKDCRFGYRDSIFKHELKGDIIVTKVTFQLSISDHTIHDSYGSLQSYLEKQNITSPVIEDIYHAVIDIRTSKLPDPDLIGNAGSFFKNPVVSRDIFDRLKSKNENMPFYEMSGDRIKIPAAWLIEKTGWKGKRIGNVGTYQNQALVIVNHGGASGMEILQFSKMIQKSVLESFDIELVPEVNLVE